MKRFISVIFISLLMAGLFAQEKIGTVPENTFSINTINGNTPVYCYYEDTQGLISTVRNFYITIGDKTYGPYEDLSYRIESNTVWYTAKTENGWQVFKNGKPYSEQYDHINYFYILKNNLPAYYYEIDGKIYIQNGNIKQGPIEKVEKALGIYETIIIYTKKDNDVYLYYKDKRYGPLGKTSHLSCASYFSIYYTWEKNNKIYLNKDGLEFAGPFDAIDLCDFSPDYKSFSYITSSNNLKTLWLNKTKIFEAKDISNVSFIDNETLAFSFCDNNNKWFVKAGDKKYGPFKEVDSITVSDDGKKTAIVYTDSSNNKYLQIGTEKAGPYKTCKKVMFSPDSKKITYYQSYYYVGKLMMNNQIVAEQEPEVLLFSEDSSGLVYIKKDYYPTTVYQIVLNDFSSELYDSIYLGKFKNNILSYEAVKDKINSTKLIFNNQEYTGSFTSDGTGYVYIDGEYIYYKKF